jgi:hypothetical protein
MDPACKIPCMNRSPRAYRSELERHALELFAGRINDQTRADQTRAGDTGTRAARHKYTATPMLSSAVNAT